MISYAILIDGGFAKRKLGTKAAPMTAQRLLDFVSRLQEHGALIECRLHRIYFYDAAPLDVDVKRPLRGGRESFRETASAKRNRQLHLELARLPYFSLRMGELDFRGWRVAPRKLDVDADEVQLTAKDLVADIAQKGVDMRIGLDIASLTLKQQVQMIVLVTGDSDFVPALKFARREGAQLLLAPIGHSIKEAMYEHADLILDVPAT